MPHRLRLLAGVLAKPGILLQLPGVAAETKLRVAAGPGGILPFGFGGQPVAVRVKVALAGFLVVAGLEPLGARPQVAGQGRFGPGNHLHRIPWPLEVRAVDGHELGILPLGHFATIHQECVDVHVMDRRFVGFAAGTAHAKLARRNADHLDAALRGNELGGPGHRSRRIGFLARCARHEPQHQQPAHFRLPRSASRLAHGVFSARGAQSGSLLPFPSLVMATQRFTFEGSPTQMFQPLASTPIISGAKRMVCFDGPRA